MKELSGMPMSSFLTLLPQSSSPKPSRKKFSPMVAMNRMMYSWFTSGRSTIRSMAKASATITSTVRTRAMGIGTPRSISPTRVRAAKSTMTPWAKLKTPEALKIRTKPRATSEYMRPAARPPIRTSTRKAGVPSMSLKGLRKMASSMRHSEVGVDHGLVSPHLVRSAVGDLAPVVERDHAIRDVHHHAHVVLDQCDGSVELVVDAEDEPAHVFLLLDVHARHRLVEQQELGLGRERAGQLDPLLEPVGQLARRGLADGLDLQEIDDALHKGAVLELLLHGRAPVQRLQQE